MAWNCFMIDQMKYTWSWEGESILYPTNVRNDHLRSVNGMICGHLALSWGKTTIFSMLKKETMDLSQISLNKFYNAMLWLSNSMFKICSLDKKTSQTYNSGEMQQGKAGTTLFETWTLLQCQQSISWSKGKTTPLCITMFIYMISYCPGQ